MAQMVKNLSAMQEIRIQSLGGEDPLEKETTTHCSILTWEISWTEEPVGLQSLGSQRDRHDRATNTFTFIFLKVVKKVDLKCYHHKHKKVIMRG